MQMHITPNNKLASLGTIGLLFLAGIAGMVFLIATSPVHAANPTVSLSTISSGILTAATSGTVGSTIVITGSGFNPAASITITTIVGTMAVSWLSAGGASSAVPAVDSLVVGGKLTATVSGNFQVEVNVPNLPGGAQTLSVSDGVNTGIASFTIKPTVSVTFAAANFGFPEEGITPIIVVTGFGSGESVTVSTPMFTTTSFKCTTGSTLGSFGASPNCGAGTTIADTTGGTKAITATGGTSGLTAATMYTVNPWAAFHNSQNGTATYSFLGSAPTSVLMEAHGLPAGTIAANSATVGGITTYHPAVIVGPSGAFGAPGSFLVVSPAASVPFGLANVVIDGTTFSYAAGNIGLGVGTWGGVLISSIVGSNSTTGVATTDASSYEPGSVTTASTTSPGPAQNTIGVFGYGFVRGNTIAINSSSGANLGSPVSAPTHADSNGAFFSMQTLLDTPWSRAATPTTPASYALTVTEAPVGQAEILSPSITIMPWIDTMGGISTTTVDYTTNSLAVKVHGFGATDTVAISVGGASMVSGGTVAVTNGGGTTAPGQVPDIAGGLQNVVARGSVTGESATAPGAVTYDPTVNFALGQTLVINTGEPGQTTILRTENGYGVHGLLASTHYDIVWNAVGNSSVVGTFTSTATGGVPSSGASFAIPSDSSGIHILDIQAALGASAIFGNLLAGQLTPSEAPFSNIYTTGYGDLLFLVTKSTPSISTRLSSSSMTVGDIVTDTATIAKGNSPTGTITFDVFSSASCTGAATFTQVVALPLASATFSGLATGSYELQATYSGDANNVGPVTSPCGTEPLTVSRASPTLSTTISSQTITVGGSITVSAILAKGYSPTGNITFFFSNTDACPFSGAIQAGSSPTVSGNGIYSSSPIVFGTRGTHYVYAVYSGDSQNNGVAGSCEALNVLALPALTTALSSPTIIAGGLVIDTATITNGDSPTGTITFDVYSGRTSASCTGTPEESATVTLPSTSATFGSGLVAGSYEVQAVYQGDSNNFGPVSNPCGSEPLTVLNTTSTTLACSPASVTVGVTSMCRAVVTGGSSPSGTVTFASSSGTGTFTPSNTCALSSGSCSVGYSNSASGTPALTASYGGDSRNAASQSPRFPLTVISSSTTITTTTTASTNTTTTTDSIATTSSTTNAKPSPWIPWIYFVPIVSVAVAAGASLAVRQSRLPPRPNNIHFTVGVTVTSFPEERGEGTSQ